MSRAALAEASDHFREEERFVNRIGAAATARASFRGASRLSELGQLCGEEEPALADGLLDRLAGNRSAKRGVVFSNRSIAMGTGDRVSFPSVGKCRPRIRICALV